MKTRVVVLVIAGVLGFAAVAVAGVLGYRMFFGAAEDDAVALVPDDALVYGNVFLDPSMSQKRAIGDLLESFSEAPTLDEARNELVDLFDEALAEIDASFEDDVDPWLGDQIAGFSMAPENLATPEVAGTPAAAFLVASDDVDAAREFLEKAASESANEFSDKSYDGVDYKFSEADESAVGIVAGFVVIGTEPGLRAVVDVSGGDPNLGDNEEFVENTDELTEDRLATLYFDGRRLEELFEGTGMAPGSDAALGNFGIGTAEPIAGAVFAESDKVVFESTSRIPEGEAGELAGNIGPGLLEELPGDSWGALGFPRFGESLKFLYDFAAQAFVESGAGTTEDFDSQFEAQTGFDIQQELLSWMGDAGIFVTGTDPNSIGGGLVAQSTDPATSSSTIEKVESLARQQGLDPRPLTAGGAQGFTIQLPDLPLPIVVLAGDKVVVSDGEQAAIDAIDAGEPLSTSEPFRRAVRGLGEGFAPTGYFDLDAIQALAESAGANQFAEYDENVKPWLDPPSYVAFGSRVGGDRAVQRLVIGID